LGCTDRSVRFRGFLWYFVTWFIFYGEELLAARPTPKLEDHPLSAVRDCLFKIFAATLHNWRPFLHPQPEDAPCRGDGPTYHFEQHITKKERVEELSENIQQQLSCLLPNLRIKTVATHWHPVATSGPKESEAPGWTPLLYRKLLNVNTYKLKIYS
jgi:hypothetical protein